MESKEIVKDFSDLLNIGSLSRTIDIKGHKVMLRTLSYDEQAGLVDSIPPEAKEFKRIDLWQKELLVVAIEAIDGVQCTKEQKRELLGKGQAVFCNFLFSEYEKMIEEQNKVLEDVKKNSSGTMKTNL